MARRNTASTTPTVSREGWVLRPLEPGQSCDKTILLDGVFYVAEAPDDPKKIESRKKTVQPMVEEALNDPSLWTRKYGEQFDKPKQGMGAQRHNEGKLMFDALPIEWLVALASVMNAGADQGYPYRNWEEGGNWSTPVGCMFRHFWRWAMIETYDTDGVHHLSKVAWNALQLLTWQIRGVGTDNLNRQPRSVVSKVTSPEKQYD